MLVATVLAVTASQAMLRADVTITITNTVEGPMAALALAGADAPRITLRIQGLKARTDMDVMGRAIATVTDVASKQIFMLDPTQKTVHRMTSGSPSGSPSASTPAAGLNDFPMPKMEVTAEPTGQTREIAGQSCSEFRTVMTMHLGQMAGAQMPPEMLEAMKDTRMVMKGSTWISTSTAGASEFITFQEAARTAGMAVPTTLFGGQNAPDPLSQAVARADGLPCLTEMEINYEGTGPMIDVLTKMGTMKVTSRIAEISLAPIAPDAFAVPPDYAESSQNPLIPPR
jgi:hypothetical protein